MRVLINNFEDNTDRDYEFKIESLSIDDADFVESYVRSSSLYARMNFSPKEFLIEWFLSEDLTKEEFIKQIKNVIDEV